MERRGHALPVVHVSLVKADWLSFDEALERVLNGASVLETVESGIDSALGRVLAEPLSARATIPASANSAMDGYAARSDSVLGATPENPARLEVKGRIAAGMSAAGVRVGAGEAVAIMTGAPVPEGADSVIRVEHTSGWRQEGEVVSVTAGSDAGRNIRLAGGDACAGETVLSAGTVVTPGAVAVATAFGHDSLKVVRAPHVRVLVTGDELAPNERYREVIEGIAVPDSNGPMLVAQARSSGAAAEGHALVGDDPDELRRVIDAARCADALVVSGGASMGDRDLVKGVLGEFGFELDFWRVRMRPGSPVGFGFLDDLPVFSLPGNPASAFVTFETLVRPFIRGLAGFDPPVPFRIRAVAGEELGSTARMTVFQRVRLNGEEPVATLSGRQGSGLVRSLGSADGLAVLPEGVTEVPCGERVEVIATGCGMYGL